MSNDTTERAGRRRNRRTTRRRSLERFQVLNGFVDFGLRGLARSEIAVWLVLYRDCKPSGLSRASLSDIARRGGMSERQATRALRALIRRGAVHVMRKGVLGRATDYSLYGPELLREVCPEIRPWLRAAPPSPGEVDTDVPK